MPEPGVWAVVVARVANGAKSRLASELDADQRRQLALAMLADVLEACASARPFLSGFAAVVDDPAARQVAERLGAVVVDDRHPHPRPVPEGEGPSAGMNAAVRLGLETVQRRGAGTAIVLPGDVPLVTADDLTALLAASAGAPRALVIGASRDGQGTNALLLRPPDVIVPAFGPPSVDRHVGKGRAAGAHVRVQANLGLALDVDTSADLAALADLPVGRHTAALLAQDARAGTACV